jgi:hypothetical protein
VRTYNLHLNDPTNSNRILLPVSGYWCEHDLLTGFRSLNDEAVAYVHTYMTRVGGAFSWGRLACGMT